jgi:hypothetical protein
MALVALLTEQRHYDIVVVHDDVCRVFGSGVA